MNMETLYKNKDWLENQYIDAQKTACDIYREFGISPNNLYVWLEKYGIKRRKWKRGNGKIELTCLYCNKTFKTNAISFKKGRKYCSKDCSIKAQLGKKGRRYKYNHVEIECNYCRKIFLEKPSRIKAYKKHYCSIECKNKDQIIFVTLFCQQCGEKYKTKPFKSRLTSTFCSRKCFYESKKGEKNPNWNNGSSFEPYGKEFNETLREKIRKRDDYMCQIISCKLKQNSHKFPIHHINYNKTDNKPFNLITLCRSHHSATNSNRDYWQSYFIDIQIQCFKEESLWL